jgi:hypothetical protein
LRHGGEGAQIKITGDVAGKVLGDDGKGTPVMQTTLLVRMSRLVRSRCRRVSYVACRSRRSSRSGTVEVNKPVEYCDASESAVMADVEEDADAESMPLSEWKHWMTAAVGNSI